MDEIEKQDVAFLAQDIQNKSYDERLNRGRIQANSFSDRSLSDEYGILSSGKLISKYENYDPTIDNEETLAQKQSAGEKWTNGLAKFGVKTLAGVVGGTLGTVNDAYNLFQTGNMSSIMDSDFTNSLQDINTKVDYKLPNYYTKAEKDMNFGQSMLTANFYANDVLGGASFTASAILTEAIWAGVTGGTSLSTTATRLGTKLAVASAKKTAKMAVMRSATKALSTAGELARTARFTMTSAGYEAKVESFQFRKDMMDSVGREFEELNKRPATREEMLEIQDNIETATTSLFTYNMAIVGASNLAVLGKAFDIRTPTILPSKWVNSKVFGAGLDRGGKAIKATKLQKISRTGYSFLKSPIVEGWEEGMQSVGGNTAESWVKAQFDPKYIDNSLSVFEAFGSGMYETLTTKEGLKEIGIGMLIGGATGSGMAVAGKRLTSDFTNIDLHSKQMENFRDKYSPNQIAAMITYAGRVQMAEENAKASQSFSDQQTSRATAMLAQLSYAHDLDYFNEAMEETITAMSLMSNEEISKEYSVTLDEAATIKEKAINEYKTIGSQFKNNKDFVDAYFDSNMSKEGLSREDAQVLKDAAAYELTIGEHTYEFLSDLITTIKQEVGNTDNSSAIEIDNILRNTTIDSRKEFNKQRITLEKSIKELESLESERRSVLSLQNTADVEQQRSMGLKLNDVTQRISEATAKKVENFNKAKLALNAAKITNPYNKSSFEAVSDSDILDTGRRLDNIKNEISELKQTNPQKAQKLERLLDEYDRANTLFGKYKNLTKDLLDPELGFKGQGSLLKRIFGDSGNSDVTTRMISALTDTANNITADKTASVIESNDDILRTAVQDSSDDDIADLPKTEEDTKEQELTSIQSIIENNPYLKSKGELTEKPTMEDIIEFQEEGENSSEEVKEKLANWELYEGFEEGGVTLKDILEQNDIQRQEPNKVIQSDLTDAEVGTIVRSGETSNESDTRPEDIIQVYEGVQVRRTATGDSIHNISLQGLLDMLDIKSVIKIESGSEVIRGIGLVESKEGEEVIVENSDGSRSTIKVDKGRVLRIKNLEGLMQDNSVTDYKYSYLKGTGYSFLYKEGKVVQSDFKGADYAPAEIYKLLPGDQVTFKIDETDAYNVELLSSGKTREEKASLVKVYIVDSEGNILGDLKSSVNTKGSENFNLIRDLSLSILENGGGQIPFTGTVKNTLLGTPNIEVDDAGQPTRFSAKSGQVIDYGTSSNGKLNLKGNTENVRTTFVKGGTFNVAVLKIGNTLFAYPVEFSTKKEGLLDEGVNILEDNTKTVAKRIIDFNRHQLKNGISPVLYYKGSEDQNVFKDDGDWSNIVIEQLDVLDNTRVEPQIGSVEEFEQQAVFTINPDGKTLVAPKVVLDYESMSIPIEASDAQVFEKSLKVENKAVAKILSKLKGIEAINLITTAKEAFYRLELMQSTDDGSDISKFAISEAKNVAEESLYRIVDILEDTYSKDDLKEYKKERTSILNKIKALAPQVKIKQNKAIEATKRLEDNLADLDTTIRDTQEAINTIDSLGKALAKTTLTEEDMELLANENVSKRLFESSGITKNFLSKLREIQKQNC